MSQGNLETALQGVGITLREERAELSADLFPVENAPEASLVAAPTSPQEVAAAVKAAYDAGSAIFPRGGGMSYTGGYRPVAEPSVLLDLGALNSVRTIDAENRVAIVDSACTWKTLSEALDGTGLRSALRGPISGSHSTVGGACSQSLPGSMDAVLGLEIAGHDGALTWTGSLGAEDHSGFYRNYGPDMTGLFLGDAGTLGIKTGVALRLEPKPEGAAFASFGFRDIAETTAVMVALSKANLGGRAFALDPLKNKTSTKVGMKEGAETLAKVVKEGGLVRGLKNAAKIAIAGQNAYDDVPWSLHLTFEGATQDAAESALAQAKAICAGTGREIEPSIPVAMYASAYSIRGFLGIKGERWVPLHSIFPLGEAEDAVGAIHALFAEEAETLAKHGIVFSFMLAANGPYFLIEPMFYWPDKRLSLHERSLDERRLAKMTDFDDNPEARDTVRRVRTRLRDLAFSRGAIACQLGRFYPYRTALSPETRALYDTLKGALDPKGLFNPGALETEQGGAV